jgi:hypothetical protein
MQSKKKKERRSVLAEREPIIGDHESYQIKSRL